MKKVENFEIKLYRLLGVNIFRKYVLFTWEKITKKLKLDVGYRLDNLSVDALNSYKQRIIGFAIAHSVLLVIMPFFFKGLSNYICGIGLNFYCVMVQRYNYIRIDQILDKKAKQRKETITIENEEQCDSPINPEKMLSSNKNIQELNTYKEILKEYKYFTDEEPEPEIGTKEKILN